MPDKKTQTGEWVSLPSWGVLRRQAQRGQLKADTLVRGQTEDPDINFRPVPAYQHPELADCYSAEDTADLRKKTQSEAKTKQKPESKPTPKVDIPRLPRVAINFTQDHKVTTPPAGASPNVTKNKPALDGQSKRGSSDQAIRLKTAQAAEKRVARKTKTSASAKPKTAPPAAPERKKKSGLLLLIILGGLAFVGYKGFGFFANEGNGSVQSTPIATPEPLEVEPVTPKTKPVKAKPQTPVEPEETPARILIKVPNAYPVETVKHAKPGTITIKFDVSKQGRPVNMRIIGVPDSDFVTPAIIALADWKYEPATRGGVAIIDKDLTETFRFSPSAIDKQVIANRNSLSEQSVVNRSSDLAPSVAPQPYVPPKKDIRPAADVIKEAKRTKFIHPISPQRALKSGSCDMVYDVEIDGSTSNVKAERCSQSMFRAPSTRAISQWRFAPKTVNGRPQASRNLKQKITYNIVDERGRAIPE